MEEGLFYSRITNRILNAEIVGSIFAIVVLSYNIVVCVNIIAYYTPQEIEIFKTIDPSFIFLIVILLGAILELRHIKKFKREHDFSAPYEIEVKKIRRTFKSRFTSNKFNVIVVDKKIVNYNIFSTTIFIIIALLYIFLNTYILLFA